MDTDKFYIGKCDYGFHYLIRLFGKDILYLKRKDIFNLKQKFLRLFRIMGICKFNKMNYIFFRNSIWKFGFTNPKGGKL